MARPMEGQPGYQQQAYSEGETSGLAMGFIFFAAALMIMLGSFHAIAGFVGILDDAFYVTPREYFGDFSVNTWGWVHLFSGLIAIAAGFGLLGGAMWARIIGVVIAFASALVNFTFLPHYPVWSILMIALSIGVIWALIAHGRELSME